jgi:hypothetical protein
MTLLCNAFEGAALNQIFRNQALSAPATVYGRLFTADPGEAGSLTAEVGAGDYAAQAIPFGAAASGQISSSAALNFNSTPAVSWGTPTFLGFATAASGGSLITRAPLVPAQPIGVGAPLSIPAGDVQVIYRPGSDRRRLTIYTATRLADQLFRAQTVVWPSTIYLALLKEIPAPDGTGGDEVATSGTDYTRKSFVMAAAVGDRIGNASAVTFTTAASAAYGTVKAVAVYDAATSGNMLAYTELDGAKIINAGNPVAIDADKAFWTLD